MKKAFLSSAIYIRPLSKDYIGLIDIRVEIRGVQHYNCHDKNVINNNC